MFSSIVNKWDLDWKMFHENFEQRIRDGPFVRRESWGKAIFLKLGYLS